jgi:hypothetical protein
MNKKAIIIGICFVVALLVIGGIWKWENNIVKDQQKAEIKEERNENTEMNKSNQPSGFEDLLSDLTLMEAIIPDMSNWIEYKDDTLGFSIKIPKDWYAENSNGKFVCIKSKTRKFYFEGEESCGVVVSKNSESDFIKFIKMSKKDNDLRYIELDSEKILYMSGYSLPRVAIKNKDAVWEVSIQGADNSIKNETLYGIINSMRFK